jgi:3,4-dihydroxy 2-butanone 4-phosphate synthase / GTP cyclohydrolase II
LSSWRHSPAERVHVAVRELSAGRLAVIVDDGPEARGGVLVAAADQISAAQVRFMTECSAGVVYLALDEARCAELRMERVMHGERSGRLAFTVTIDALGCIGTGASPSDRARTIQTVADPRRGRDAIVRGGHVHPVVAQSGGVLASAEWPEAAVDLVAASGRVGAAACSPMLGVDGNPIAPNELRQWCETRGIPIVPVHDVVVHRTLQVRQLQRVVSTTLPTRFGTFEAVGYHSPVDGGQHMALVKGDIAGREDVLVRIHAQDVFGDVFRQHGESPLDGALEAVQLEPCGVIVYVADALNGFGVADPFRSAETGGQILRDLGPTSVRLLAANKTAVAGVRLSGVQVAGCVALTGTPS